MAMFVDAMNKQKRPTIVNRLKALYVIDTTLFTLQLQHRNKRPVGSHRKLILMWFID